MSIPELILLAVTLVLDVVVVATACGASLAKLRVRDVTIFAAIFGFAHVAMPAIGWLVGGQFVGDYNQWIACVVFVGLGIKMLVSGGDAAERFDVVALIGLAIACSIDALAAGVTLPMVDLPLPLALATFGGAAVIASIAGLVAGRQLGAIAGKHFGVVGGLVLIALGIKAVVL